MTIHNPGTKVPTYSPLWTAGTKLPRDRVTMNAWARSFYALNPDVNRIINQHALLLTSIYEIEKGESKETNDFCKEQLEDLKFPNLIETIIREYLIIGEVFLYLELNKKENKWNNVYIQNPDYILIKKDSINGEEAAFLRPDENLRRICVSNKPEDIETCKLLPKSVVKSVKNGENISMQPYNFWYMIYKLSPYDIRGNSFILPLFNILRKEILSDEENQIIRSSLGDIMFFNGKGITKDVLMTRYLIIIQQLENWFNHKLLEPVVELRNLNDKLPQVKFNKDRLRKYIEQI